MTGLKTVCPTCGSVDEENRHLTEAVARLTRENSGLRGQLTQMHRSGPDMAEVYEVLDYWKLTLGKRKDTVFGDSRIKAVRARLKEGFTVDRLKRAVDGCKLDDWAMGRVAKTGGKTFNDIGKYICKSDEAVEHFEAMLDKPKPQAPPRLQVVKAQADDPFARPLDRALVAFRREYGTDSVLVDWVEGQYASVWWTPCPLHPNPIGSRPLRLRESNGIPGRSLIVECVSGCLPSEILEAIRRLEWRDEQHAGPVAA